MRAALLVCLLLGACDPVMGLRGVVRTTPSADTAGADVYAGGQPLAGARMMYLCHDSEKSLGETDEQGRVRGGWVGEWPTSCAIRVEKEGFHPQTFAIAEMCVMHRGDGCHFVSINAELVPMRP